MALLLRFALAGIRHLPLAALKQDTSKQQPKRCDKNNKTNICDKRCQGWCAAECFCRNGSLQGRHFS